MFSWPAPRRGSWFTALDQLGDRVPAVADHVPRHPVRRGDQLAVDHQQPVVVALDHALDHDARALVDRDVEGVGDLLVGGQVDRDAAPVVAVERLHHHREADARSPRRPRPRRRGRGSAAAPAGRGPRAAASRAPCRRRSRRRYARSGWSAPPRCASGTCPGRPGSGWRRSGAPRGCRAPRPRAPAPAPTGRAPAGRRSSRSRRSPRRCRSASAVARRDQLDDDAARHVARLEPDLLGLVAVEHLDLVLVRPGPRHRDVGRRAGVVLQRDRDLRHQLAQPAVRRPLSRSPNGSPPSVTPLASPGRCSKQRPEQRVAIVRHRRLRPPVQVDGQPDQRRLA